MGESLGSSVLDLSTDDSKLRSGLKSAQSLTKSGMKSMAGIIGTAAKATAVGLGVAGAAVGAFGLKAVQMGSDLAETMSKTEQVFGKSTDKVTSFAQDMADSFGLPEQAILDAASNIGLVAKASGLGADAAAGMSTEMAQLAADASSFFNVPLDESLEKIRAGLVGEAEPLRAFGVLLSAAAVQEKAVELGIAGVSDELTEQQKVMARAAIIREQMGDASGDLARTQKGVANRLREIRGRFENFTAALGERLLPVAEEALGRVSEVLSEFFAKAERNVFPVIDRLVEAFSKDGLAGVLAEAGDIFADIGPGILDSIQGVFSSILEFVTSHIGDIVQFLLDSRGAFFNAAVTVFTSLVHALPQIVPQLVDALLTMITTLVTTLADLAPLIIQAALQLILGLVDGILLALPSVIDAVIVLITTVLMALLEALPKLIEAGLELTMAILQGLLQALPQIIDFVTQDLIPGIIEMILQNLPVILRAGVDILLALIDGLVQAIPQLLSAIVEMIPQIVDMIVDNLPLLVEAGVEITLSLLEGLIDAIPDLLSEVAKIPGDIIDEFPNPASLLWDIGSAIIGGLIDGIQSGMPSLGSSLAEISAFIVKNKGPLPEDRVMLVPAGEAIMAGLEEGLANELGSLEAMLGGVSADITSTLTVDDLPAADPSNTGRHGWNIENLNVDLPGGFDLEDLEDELAFRGVD